MSWKENSCSCVRITKSALPSSRVRLVNDTMPKNLQRHTPKRQRLTALPSFPAYRRLLVRNTPEIIPLYLSGVLRFCSSPLTVLMQLPDHIKRLPTLPRKDCEQPRNVLQVLRHTRNSQAGKVCKFAASCKRP